MLVTKQKFSHLGPTKFRPIRYAKSLIYSIIIENRKWINGGPNKTGGEGGGVVPKNFCKINKREAVYLGP